MRREKGKDSIREKSGEKDICGGERERWRERER